MKLEESKFSQWKEIIDIIHGRKIQMRQWAEEMVLLLDKEVEE